jgi:aminoglycoside phosphotransferase (APT) family kinase protein
VTSATAEVPSTISDVNPQWLTALLRADGTTPDSATVTEIRAEQIAMDTGFSSLLYRLHVTASEGVPSSFIVKLPAQSEARGAMEMMGGYRREVAFYQQVAGRAPMRTPHVYAARMAPNDTDFVLVLEDMKDWENADHLAGLSLNRARTCIAQLAGLHAWSADPANASALEAFPSLDGPMTRDVFPAVFGQGWQVYREKTQAPVPPAVAGYAERFAEHAPAAMNALTERSMLVHGDIRADNMFFDGDRLKVVDFQFASRGAGVADIAYLVSQGLPTEVRRGHDKSLVCEYLAFLRADGVTDYSLDEAWRQYRFAVAYLMVLPVITLNGWDAMPERSRALCLKLTERAVATIDDIDALEVFA